MTAPGTGPVTRATDRHTPAPDMDTARSRARSALAARNTQVGPEPATSAPSAPSSSPAASVLRSAGNSDTAAGCRSLLSVRPTGAASPERSADISAASRSGDADRADRDRAAPDRAARGGAAPGLAAPGGVARD